MPRFVVLVLIPVALTILAAFWWLRGIDYELQREGSVPEASDRPSPSLPQEPVKQNLRDAGNGVVAPMRPHGDMVERLPAKPVPKVRKPAPSTLRLVRPLIDQPGELTSGTQTVVLAHIVAASLDRQCGVSGRPCGRQARTALRQLVRGRTVHCEILARTQPPRAQCKIGKTDLAQWLVEQGWAEASPGGPFEAQMAQARRRKTGLWAQ